MRVGLQQVIQGRKLVVDRQSREFRSFEAPRGVQSVGRGHQGQQTRIANVGSTARQIAVGVDETGQKLLGPSEGRQAPGNQRQPKKLRPKLAGLQYMNDSMRTIDVNGYKGQKTRLGSKVSDQMLPASKHSGVDGAAGGSRAPAAQMADEGSHQQRRDLHRQTQEMKEKFLPQLGRANKKQAEPARKPFKNPRLATISDDASASLAAAGDAQRRDSFFGNITPLSMRLQTAREEQAAATKPQLPRSRLGAASGSPQCHGATATLHTPLMNGGNNQISLIGEGPGAGKLMNFTLMEQLSNAYKETGKYDVSAIRGEMAQKEAAGHVLSAKNSLQGAQAYRMASQGTPSAPLSLQESPISPQKLTCDLLSSKLSTWNKQRLKPIEDSGHKRTLYRRIYFNKGLSLHDSFKSQPSQEELALLAENGSQETHDRTGTDFGRQLTSPNQASYMQHPPSFTMTKYTTMRRNPERKDASQLMHLRDNDIQQLQRFYKQGFNQAGKQSLLRSQMAKAKNSISMNRQVKVDNRELERNKERPSLMAKQASRFGTRSRSTLESMGQEQIKLHKTLDGQNKKNETASITRNVRVHDSKQENANHFATGRPAARPRRHAHNQETSPASKAPGAHGDQNQQHEPVAEQNLDIQAQQFVVASLERTYTDQIPSSTQVDRIQAVPIRQNDYNAFLMKNEESIRALQTLPARRARNSSVANNPRSNDDGVTYEPSPNRHESEEELALSHQRDITLSNNNINACPTANERNKTVFNQSSLYVSPRRPLSDCNSDSKEMDTERVEAQKSAVMDSKQQLLGSTILSSLRNTEPSAICKSQIAHESNRDRNSKLAKQDTQNILGPNSDEFQLKLAPTRASQPISPRAPFVHQSINLYDQTQGQIIDQNSSNHHDILSNNSIASQLAEHQENLPRLQRLAQIDYVMNRISSQFKMEVLNKYGLTQSGYGALFNSRDSFNSMQSLDRDKNHALGPLNLIFGQDAEGLRNIKSNIKSHQDHLNDSPTRADLEGMRAQLLDSVRSGDSSQFRRSMERAAGPINVVSQRSALHMNIVESHGAKRSQSKTENLKEAQKKAPETQKKFDSFEQRDVTDADRRYLPPDLLQQIEKDNEAHLSNEKKQQVWDACQFIDNMVKDREAKAKERRRMFKDPDIFKDRDEEMDEILGEAALPSSLERQRIRKLKEFKEQMDRKRKEIIKIQEPRPVDDDAEPNAPETAGLHSQKASKVFQDLMEQDLDPEIRRIGTIDIQTATFLGKIIKDVHSTSERNEIVKKLQDDLKALMLEQLQFDIQIKHKIAVKKRKQQEKALKNIMNKIKGRTDMKITPAIKKLQNVVNTNLLLEKPKAPSHRRPDMRKLLFGAEVQHRKKPKIKNRLQKLIKKHFFNKTKNKLDLIFVTKLARLQEQFDKIFEHGNLGEKYDQLKMNLWANEYLRDVRGKLQDINIDFDINFEKSQHGLMNFEMLFRDEVLKLQFYRQAKDFVRIDDTEPDKEKIANQNYFKTCIRNQEAPLPAFARLYRHCLFLTECRVSETMSKALAEYLRATQSDPQKITKCLFIDDCGMKDGQFAQILQGLESQGGKVKQIVYSNNDMSYKSVEVLLRLIPQLRELNFNNITRSYGKPMFNQIVEHCVDYGVQLQRLKLSNMNLNDNQIVQNIGLLLQQRPFLISLDISWARLSSKQLSQIMAILAKKYEHTLRNLNISYNSLTQPPKDENAYFDENDPNYLASEDFVEHLCEFMQKNDFLYHLDLSGMNLADEQILQISQTATMCEGLIAIHLSDNGIRAESQKELLGEVLDLFGLSEDIFKDREYRVNNPVSSPQELRNIIKKYTLSLNKEQILDGRERIDANAYKKHLLQQKQGKLVSNKRIINQAQTSTGIGRTESSLMDNFVLQRQLNQPELIFNQCRYKDCYFEEDASEQWHLQDGACGMSGGCPVCRRHKYTLIFYQQEESEVAMSKNEGLIEITDKAAVEQIKEELNLLHQDEQEVAPLICGTVVNGSFQRKLRMLRADLFCMLSICHSAYFATDFKQIKKIKTGILANVIKSQDLNGKDESIEYLKGWHRQLIVDKCSNNETTDMAVINMPEFYDNVKALKLQAQASEAADSPAKTPGPEAVVDENCKTFVYAAYLCPGLHQFIIYCPKTQRAFCKDIIIDLNSCDCYPEHPEPLRPPKDLPKPKKITRSNVWRKWREDSEEDVQMAFLADCSDSFAPELFIKDAEDVEECKRILHENFEWIKIAYVEGLAGSPATYPEISFEYFIRTMLDQQHTEQEQKRLTRAHMELAFIRATRGDDAHGIQGTLCRGELLETLLRLCAIRHPRSVVSEYLDDFLFIYIRPQHDASRIAPIRKEIRASKKLNQLLHDNKDGLFQLFTEHKVEPKGFTFDSAKALLNPLSPRKNEPLILTLREQFVYSKMTNLKDLQEASKYHVLVYVEFLEFICRVAREYWAPIRESGGEAPPIDIEDTVYGLLEMMWARRMKTKPKTDGAPKKKSKKKAKPFPELVACMPEEEDSD